MSDVIAVESTCICLLCFLVHVMRTACVYSHALACLGQWCHLQVDVMSSVCMFVGDVTPPAIFFNSHPFRLSANVTIGWAISEEANSTCFLQDAQGTVTEVVCDLEWRGLTFELVVHRCCMCMYHHVHEHVAKCVHAVVTVRKSLLHSSGVLTVESVTYVPCLK